MAQGYQELDEYMGALPVKVQLIFLSRIVHVF